MAGAACGRISRIPTARLFCLWAQSEWSCRSAWASSQPLSCCHDISYDESYSTQTANVLNGQASVMCHRGPNKANRAQPETPSLPKTLFAELIMALQDPFHLPEQRHFLFPLASIDILDANRVCGRGPRTNAHCRLSDWWMSDWWMSGSPHTSLLPELWCQSPCNVQSWMNLDRHTIFTSDKPELRPLQPPIKKEEHV